MTHSETEQAARGRLLANHAVVIQQVSSSTGAEGREVVFFGVEVMSVSPGDGHAHALADEIRNDR